MRKVFSVLLFLGITLLVFELLLQAVSLVVYFVVPSGDGAERDASKRVVLCVGDSFTFGLGSSEPATQSYPGHLQTLLDERSPNTWQVVNVGFPGKNSQQMAEEFGSNMARYEPDYVILTGAVNDSWSDPEEVTISADQGARGFRWELRTRKVFRTITEGNLFQGNSRETPATEPQLKDEVTASTVAENPAPTSPPKRVDLLDEGWTAIREEKWEDAADTFKKISVDKWERYPGLIYALTSLTRTVEATAAMDRFIEIYEAETDPPENMTKDLVGALNQCGRAAYIANIGQEITQRFPDNVDIAFLYGLSLFMTNQISEARAQFDATAKLFEKVPGHHSEGWFWRNRARAYVGVEDIENVPSEIARSLVMAYRAEPDIALTTQEIQATSLQVPSETFYSELTKADLSDTQRSELARVYAAATDPDSVVTAAKLTGRNFREMIRFAHEHDAKVILGSYPFHMPDLVEEMKAISAETNSPFVIIRHHFDNLLKTTPRDDLFVGDGHCNDVGYKFMARLIYDGGLSGLLDSEPATADSAQ